MRPGDGKGGWAQDGVIVAKKPECTAARLVDRFEQRRIKTIGIGDAFIGQVAIKLTTMFTGAMKFQQAQNETGISGFTQLCGEIYQVAGFG